MRLGSPRGSSSPDDRNVQPEKLRARWRTAPLRLERIRGFSLPRPDERRRATAFSRGGLREQTDLLRSKLSSSSIIAVWLACKLHYTILVTTRTRHVRQGGSHQRSHVFASSVSFISIKSLEILSLGRYTLLFVTYYQAVFILSLIYRSIIVLARSFAHSLARTLRDVSSGVSSLARCFD